MATSDTMPEDICMEILSTLYTFQKEGYLCDTTLVSGEGSRFVAHAGVLAALSLPLAQHLSQCQRGDYTIETTLHESELSAFIEQCYLGTISHLSQVYSTSPFKVTWSGHSFPDFVVGQLKNFCQTGLFCDTVVMTEDGNTHPAHSYILATQLYLPWPQGERNMCHIILPANVDVQNFVKRWYGEKDIITSCMESAQEEIPVPVAMVSPMPKAKPAKPKSTRPRTTKPKVATTAKITMAPTVTMVAQETVATMVPHGSQVVTQYVQPIPTGSQMVPAINHTNGITVSNTVNGKMYTCSFCPKTFKKKGNAQQHERTHTGDKPYVCSWCSRAFSHHGNMKEHERLHTGFRPHRCEECGKAFLRRGSLKAHQRTHTGEKLFQCRWCSKAFAQKRTMLQHEKSHVGPNDNIVHHCRSCKQTFPDEQSKIVHESQHGKGRR